MGCGKLMASKFLWGKNSSEVFFAEGFKIIFYQKDVLQAFDRRTQAGQPFNFRLINLSTDQFPD